VKKLIIGFLLTAGATLLTLLFLANVLPRLGAFGRMAVSKAGLTPQA